MRGYSPDSNFGTFVDLETAEELEIGDEVELTSEVGQLEEFIVKELIWHEDFDERAWASLKTKSEDEKDNKREE